MARTESITTDIVRSGFTAIELVPYDPERVLSRINTYLQTPIPLPTLNQPSPLAPETPHNIQGLERQVRVIQGYIQRRTAGSFSLTD